MTWTTQRACCLYCAHEWIAVFPSECESLECPKCGQMGNHAIHNEEEEAS